MLKTKLISFIDTKNSATSLPAYFSQCISEDSQNSKEVGILVSKETLYSKYVSKCMDLEHHFRPFYSLIGYLDGTSLDEYSHIRNTLSNLETCILIGDSKKEITSLISQTASNKAEHRVANIQRTATLSDDHTIYNLGYTRHNTPLKVLDILGESTSLSLGQIKHNVSDTEPYLRDVRLACLDISMISSTLVGLTIFEMCSLLRYLGYSNTLDTIYIYHENLDHSEEAMEQMAILIWYFLEGRQHRQEDYPSNPSNQKYVVYSALLNTDIEFAKSKLTGRWWMQNPENKSNYIPISFSEYQATVNNDIPTRLLEEIS